MRWRFNSQNWCLESECAAKLYSRRGMIGLYTTLPVLLVKSFIRIYCCLTLCFPFACGHFVSVLTVFRQKHVTTEPASGTLVYGFISRTAHQRKSRRLLPPEEQLHESGLLVKILSWLSAKSVHRWVLLSMLLLLSK